MLVIDKPAGIALHRGPKGGENLEDYFDAPSGCLLLGRHHKALEKLDLLLKQGKIAKTYWAIVKGTLRKTKV